MKYLLLIPLLFALGCAQTSRYDLTAIPAYDMQAATEAWSIVQTVQVAREEFIQELVARIYRGEKPGEAERDEISRLMDQVIYWKAAAEIQIFHADYMGAHARAAEGN